MSLSSPAPVLITSTPLDANSTRSDAHSPHQRVSVHSPERSVNTFTNHTNIYAQNHCNRDIHNTSPIPINDITQSPQRIRRVLTESDEDGEVACASPVRELIDGPHTPTPSSPLLTAMREAVDSINQYEDFEILEKIGAGFFADVFKVRHIPTEEVMVLKLNKRMTGIKKLKEVELLKKLYHPNILHYYGACVHNGQLHPVTEYMNGGALEQLIQNQSVPLPTSLRLKLALDIARGMDYLHRHGMLHRDLNSKNCLLRKHGDSYTAVVADFGLAAKAPRVIRPIQRTQSVVGNPFWMAPEVINGKPYDEKADVFSFGIILCELISRLEADPDELPRSRDFGLDEAKFRALPSVVECSPPEDLLSLTFHCCQIVPVKRPDFTDLRGKLEMLLSGSAGSILPPPTYLSHDEDSATPHHRLSSHQHNLSPSNRETSV